MRRPAARSGFTLVEVMIATAMAMVLLFAALQYTSESIAVVREGDVHVHTRVASRHVLDKFLSDVRYCDDLAVSGDQATGWEVQVLVTDTLSSGWLTYAWDPVSKRLTVSDGSSTEVLLEDLRTFELSTQAADIGGVTEITHLAVNWEMGLDSGREAGADGVSPELVFRLSGGTWVRRNDV